MLRAKDGVLGDGFGTALAAEGNLLVGRGAGGDRRWRRVRVRARLRRTLERAGPTHREGGADGDRLGASVALQGGCCSPARRDAKASAAPSSSSRGEECRRVEAARGHPGLGRRGAATGSAPRWLSMASAHWSGRPAGRLGRSIQPGGGTGQALSSGPASGSWSEEARLAAADARIGHGSLGVAVLLDGTEALVGAPRVDSLAGAWSAIAGRAPPGRRPAPSLPTRTSGRPASDPRWPATAATFWSERPLST